jgi:predicted kinase
LVHHRCHNAIHERFGYTSIQKVYIVYGPPLSGKTTYVRASKGRKDLVLDLDELYRAITLLPPYDKPSELALNIFQLRDVLSSNLGSGKTTPAYRNKRMKIIKNLHQSSYAYGCSTKTIAPEGDHGSLYHRLLQIRKS